MKVMFATIREEIQNIFREDPAAKSWIEIVLLYPGFHAIVLHRLAHWLFQMQIPFLPRMISQFSRFITGVEIHPGAKIGRRFFIDHGMGVVIGETAEVGDDVLIYQGVTLGGTGKERGKRHPTIGDNVVLGTGAKVLGNIFIGHDSKIGAGSVVLSGVPPHSTVVGIPGRVVRARGVEPDKKLEHCNMPDPEGELIRSLTKRIEQLETELHALREDSHRRHTAAR